jgi:hypothetical protein
MDTSASREQTQGISNKYYLFAPRWSRVLDMAMPRRPGHCPVSRGESEGTYVPSMMGRVEATGGSVSKPLTNFIVGSETAWPYPTPDTHAYVPFSQPT